MESYIRAREVIATIKKLPNIDGNTIAHSILALGWPMLGMLAQNRGDLQNFISLTIIGLVHILTIYFVHKHRSRKVIILAGSSSFDELSNMINKTVMLKNDKKQLKEYIVKTPLSHYEITKIIQIIQNLRKN